jgi:hypothetical protein
MTYRKVLIIIVLVLILASGIFYFCTVILSKHSAVDTVLIQQAKLAIPEPSNLKQSNLKEFPRELISFIQGEANKINTAEYGSKLGFSTTYQIAPRQFDWSYSNILNVGNNYGWHIVTNYHVPNITLVETENDHYKVRLVFESTQDIVNVSFLAMEK